jgi:glycolate oxidase iron-sulfur subunit
MSYSETAKSTAMPDSAALIAEANRCVACGLCLPTCPTYAKTGSEADSPRGRVMLIRALAEQGLVVESAAALHLERCLGCRACEAVCPSGVRYGRLIDGGRWLLAEKGRAPTGAERWVPGLLSQQTLLHLFQRMCFRQRYDALGRERGEVALFLGCAARIVDVATLRAAIFVLCRLGYTVHVPAAQGCCGAIYQHRGDEGQAARLADQNVAAFRGLPEMPVLFAATGCGASLVEFGRYGDPGAAFAARARDVVSFIADADGWADQSIVALAETIAVHEPCSSRNVLRTAEALYRVVDRIPQARIVALLGNETCCGSAGLYSLRQPEIAGRLRDDKMRAIRGAAPRYLVSSNVGCALWLRSGIRKEPMEVEVLHPVTLLARQMGFDGKC